MAIIDKIKNKSRINVSEITTLLKKDLNVDDNGLEDLYYSLYATLQLILNTTNRDYIIEDMFTLWVDMTKDYWFLNRYDKKQSSSSGESEEESQAEDEGLKVKRVERGDTNIEFRDSNNETTINGVTYKTGTIDYDEDMLLNKYLKRLYKFRLLGRKRRW